jgi:hypothetical protein
MSTVTDQNESDTDRNTLAEHGDSRVEAQSEEYGELADLEAEDLQQRAREEGVLLEALSAGR